MLTDVQVKKAKGAEKPYKLSDFGGLFLLVWRTGNRSWRMKYRFGGKEKLLTFGSYPEVSLIRAPIRKGEGGTPRRARPVRREKAGRSCAHAWRIQHLRGMRTGMVRVNKPRWSEVHAGNVIDSMEAVLFPRDRRDAQSRT